MCSSDQLSESSDAHIKKRPNKQGTSSSAGQATQPVWLAGNHRSSKGTIHQLSSQYVATNHLGTFVPAVHWATSTAGCHWAGTDPTDGTWPAGTADPLGAEFARTGRQLTLNTSRSWSSKENSVHRQ